MTFHAGPARFGRVAAGVDVEAPSDAGGRSILDRFEAGEFGGEPDQDDPYVSFLKWFHEEGRGRSPGLRVFRAEQGVLPRDPWRLVLGMLVSEIPWESGARESMDSAEVEAALEETGRALRAWGIVAEPGLFLMEELEDTWASATG